MVTDMRQTSAYGRYMEAIGWRVIKEGRWQAFEKKPLPGFVIIKIQRVPDQGLEKLLERCAQEMRAGYIKVEPAEELGYAGRELLEKKGWHQDTWPLLPSRTLEIDLERPWEEITKEFSVNAWRNIKAAWKNGLEVWRGDVKLFHEHWQSWSKVRRVPIMSYEELTELVKAFGEDVLVLNCVAKEEWLAGVVLVKAGETMHYYQAASNEKGRQLRAPFLLVWEGLLAARDAGCTRWDFEGIEDVRFKATRAKDWQGFGEFKKKFGGREKTFVGSYSKYYGWARLLGWLEKLPM